MQLIGASIDLSKVDKSKIIEGKNGAKYYNFTVIVNDEPNQYGKDVAITQEQTKEQREAKEPRVFIGNGKTFWRSTGNYSKDERKDEFKNAKEITRDGITTPVDDLPF